MIQQEKLQEDGLKQEISRNDPGHKTSIKKLTSFNDQSTSSSFKNKIGKRYQSNSQFKIHFYVLHAHINGMSDNVRQRIIRTFFQKEINNLKLGVIVVNPIEDIRVETQVKRRKTRDSTINKYGGSKENLHLPLVNQEELKRLRYKLNQIKMFLFQCLLRIQEIWRSQRNLCIFVKEEVLKKCQLSSYLLLYSSFSYLQEVLRLPVHLQLTLNDQMVNSNAKIIDKPIDIQRPFIQETLAYQLNNQIDVDDDENKKRKNKRKVEKFQKK
ncbi:unnamed protein product [Paramecium primaurelia]|uniref:Uncharacterized protein n=1 Tax=Paramecium primaurelia TaxID=5886 RepID=A0A8S1NGS0_PARPR|nr:unnamed protein product [Paramecium primaurelia]